jgi:hypothetical protein
MALLAGVLSLHDVKDVEALADRALSDTLKSWGARLERDDREDLLAYLIGVAWEIAPAFDKAKTPSFSTFAYRRLRLRTVDWYRQRFGDARYGEQPPVAITDEQRQEASENFDFSGPEVLDLMNSTFLSPGGQRAMLRLVKPMVQDGLSEIEAIRAYSDFTGRPSKDVRRMLSDLREELACKALLAA